MQNNNSVFMTSDTIPSVLISSMEDPIKKNTSHHRAYLPSVLDDYQPLVPLLDILYQSGREDTVSLVLNGDGGMLSTASHISTSIERSEAVVITEAFGRISSAHSLVYLCGDVIIPVRNTIAMYHNMSMGSYGSGKEPVSHVESSLVWCHSIFDQFLMPFLTLEEVDNIIEHNRTIWMPSEEDINNRVFTTMWYRAVMGLLKPEAVTIFASMVQSGLYQDCCITNHDTVLEGLMSLTPEDEESLVGTWEYWENQGLLGDCNNPIDYIESLMK